jgi:hypothetical protein
MSSTEYQHNDDDEYVTELTHTDTQTAETYGHIPYRQLRVSLSDGQISNDGTDTVTVTVEVVSGLDVARGDDPTVLDYDGDVTLSVDGQQTTKTLTNGTVSFDLTTDKPAGSEIEILAESLADHPAESDHATIEVTSQ